MAGKKARADKRKECAEKANATKKENLKREIDVALEGISVKRVDVRELRSMALAEKAEWEEYHHDNYESDPWAAPEHVITRWIVNFIRHNLVCYDEALDQWKGKVGIYDEYPRFRDGILAKIAEVYSEEPDIVKECKGQMSNQGREALYEVETVKSSTSGIRTKNG